MGPDSFTPAPSGGAPERRDLGWFIAAMVLVASSTWVIGQNIKSPRQAASEAGPPSPSDITATVRSARLSDTIVGAGTFLINGSFELHLGAVPGVERQIATAVPKRRGSLVREGDLVIEVSGRPVFALSGRVPMYRTIRPTISGPDVVELQAALVRLGYRVGQRAVFDSMTELALTQFYLDRRYSPPMHRDSVVASPVELAMIPGLPKQVISSSAKLGESTDGLRSALTLASTHPFAVSRITEGERRRVDIGSRATIQILGTGRLIPARVSWIARTSSSDASTGQQGYLARISPIRPVTANAVGRDVSVAIAGFATRDRGLLVPIAAIWTMEDGSPYVTVLDSDGRRAVPVALGPSGDGLVEITPADALAPGDTVIIGMSTS